VAEVFGETDYRQTMDILRHRHRHHASGSEALKLDKVSEHFEARCGAVHVVPFEPHLAEGAEFDFAVLRPVTAQAYLELAGAVSDHFSRRRSSDDVH
jgi:MinD-like ATPase involved in chromosome partitioning or flagellar assembly